MSTTTPRSDTPSLPAIDVVHLLPCKIDYVGPAPVAQYFDATRSVANEREKTETASFRGRPLNGVEIPLEENGFRLYKATVIKSVQNGDRESAPSNFQLTDEIKRLMYWNLDKPTSRSDQLPKLMAYLGAAKAFAMETADQQ